MQGLAWGVRFYNYPKRVLGTDAAITGRAYLKKWPCRPPVTCALRNESAMLGKSSAP